MTLRRAWLPGLAAGAWSGFALLEFSPVGVLLLVMLVGGAIAGLSAAFLGGAMLGTGGAVGLVLLLANLDCAGQLATDGGACRPPDLSWWFRAAAAMLVIGAVATTFSARALWRSRAR